MWFTGRRDLVRVDPDLGREVDRYRLVDRDYPMGLVGLAAGAGSLWVASKEAGEVLRVDPANGHVQARIAMKSPLSLAYAAGAVWAVSDQGGLANRCLHQQRHRDRAGAQAALLGRCRRRPPGRRTRPRAPSTRSTRRARSWRRTGTGDGARSVSFATGRCGSPTPTPAPCRRIDAASGAVRTYRFGHPLGDAVAVGGTSCCTSAKA